MDDLKQCPYDRATKCRMTHPCKLCDTYTEAKKIVIEGEDMTIEQLLREI